MRPARVALAGAIWAVALIPTVVSSPNPVQAVDPIVSIVFEGATLGGLPTGAEEFGPPGIHDNGQAAFIARAGTTCGLYQGDGSSTPTAMAVDGASVPPYGSLSLCPSMNEQSPLVFGDGSIVFQGFLSGGCGSPPCRTIMVDVTPGASPPPLVLVKEGDAVPGGGTLEAPLLIEANNACENDMDDDPTDDGGTPTVNDGCPAIGAAETAGAQCSNDVDDDGDAMVNDGCVVVGTSGETGSRILFRDPVAGGAEGLLLATAPSTFSFVVRAGDSLPLTAGSGTVVELTAAALDGSAIPYWRAAMSGSRAEQGIYKGTIGGAVSIVVGANDPETGCSGFTDDDSDGRTNEGCDAVPSAESGAQCTNASDDDSDGRVNDGCAAVGQPEKGTYCHNTLNDDVGDDGGTPRVNDGCAAFDPEVNQCDEATDNDSADDGGVSKVNDGCPTAGSTAESGAQCDDNVNDDPTDDNAVNDGCPAVGSSAETNQCDDTSDQDGDGAANDGCPTGGDYWTNGATYSDPIVSLGGGPGGDLLATSDHNEFYNSGIGDPNDPDRRPPTATFGAVTSNESIAVLAASGELDDPVQALLRPTMKLVAKSDPWYGGESYTTLGVGGPCDNSTDDDPADDGGSPTVNDGCPAVGAAESGSQCTNAVDDDGDEVVNDGCPKAGTYGEGDLSSAQSVDNSGSAIVVGGSAGGTDRGIIINPGGQKIIKKGEPAPVGGGVLTNFARPAISGGGTIVTGATTNGSCISSPCTTIIKVTPSCKKDKDGDSLMDCWEVTGMDVNNDGTIDLNLAAMGADPDKKDVFVEVDYMDCAGTAEGDLDNGGSCSAAHSHKPLGGMIEGGAGGPNNGVDSCNDGVDNDGGGGTDTADSDCSVVKAFKDSPAYNPTDQEDGAAGSTCNDGIDNPGGDPLVDRFDPDCQGIKLHVYVDEQLGHADYMDFPGAGNVPCNPGAGGHAVDGKTVASFNAIKSGPPGSGHFMTAVDRASANSAKIKSARRQVFHYAIFSHSQVPANSSSGCAELPGNDFYVSLGSWQNGVNDLDEVEGTFMHELGHNLGLCHAGPATLAKRDGECATGFEANYKPNYLSVMNYTFQFSRVQADTNDPKAVTGRPLDYSHFNTPATEDGNLPGTCENGIDDPGDDANLIDFNDPDCYLNEAALTEANGIDSGIPDVTNEDGAGAGSCSDGIDNPGGDLLVDGQDPDCFLNGLQLRNTAWTVKDNTLACKFLVGTATGSKDWDGDSTPDGPGLVAPIKDPVGGATLNCQDAGPGQKIRGYRDWPFLDFNFRGAQGYGDGVSRGALPPDGERPEMADADGDGLADAVDNCLSVSNPAQENLDGDALGDVCDVDDDNDSVADTAEGPCGSDPLDVTPPLSRPERLDGVFATVDDDGDTEVDEALPGGAANFDCDGDGYRGDGPGVGNISEKRMYMAAGTANDQDPCGVNGWPADLVAGSGPTANRINLTDLSSFIAPLPRKLGADPGDPGYDVRWDLVTGNGAALPKDISVTDISNIAPLLFPPLLFGVKAFGGPVCPWPP